MTDIKEALLEFNPWWKGNFSSELKDREIYAEIRKFMSSRQIIALVGLRRVGKTSLMQKIISDSIKNKADKKNIIYFSFDEFNNIEIREMLKVYAETIEKDLKNGSYLLLLDEIQKLKNWENQIKTIYDIHGKKIKIIISGSESLFLRKKSKESLAGRIFEFKIKRLTFKEFLSFKGVELKPAGLYEKELLKLFDEFVLSMGFPELVNVKEKEIIKKYVKEGVVEKVLYSDMIQLFNIKDISKIKSILDIFMDDPGQMIELSSLASELNITRQTLSTYLHYLEESFLLRKLYNYSRNQRKIERKLKKYYPSLISVDLLFKEDSLSKSKVFEWLIVEQLDAEFFYRDPGKNEVDIVLTEKKISPIEVKYGKIEYGGLLAFMKKFKVNEGIIASYKIEEKKTISGKTISIIPAFKLLQRH